MGSFSGKLKSAVTRLGVLLGIGAMSVAAGSIEAGAKEAGPESIQDRAANVRAVIANDPALAGRLYRGASNPHQIDQSFYDTFKDADSFSDY